MVNEINASVMSRKKCYHPTLITTKIIRDKVPAPYVSISIAPDFDKQVSVIDAIDLLVILQSSILRAWIERCLYTVLSVMFGLVAFDLMAIELLSLL